MSRPRARSASPFSGVALALFDELRARGATILMITHDMEIAGRTDRRLRLVDGGLREFKPTGAAAPAGS